MMRFLKAFLKFLLFLLVATAVVLLEYAAIVRWALPWWACLALPCGVLGVALGVVFLKKWLLRRREERFVLRVVEQEKALGLAPPEQDLPQIRDLDERWRLFVSMLRQSHLRKQGDPLYVLPWVLVLGEPGSGKTTAIEGARIPSVLTELSPGRGTGPTKSCEWWFFENSIVFDTPGRYALADGSEADQKEWQKFLTLLARHRKREPIGGLVLTVGADRLSAGDEDALARYGRGLRRRINELMRVLGATFPIYVLVTKMDEILGMTSLSELLPEEKTAQVMGWAGASSGLPTDEAAEEAVGSVASRLRALRLVLAQRRGDPGFLVLCDEIESIKLPLAQFIRAVFQKNPYQETPPLRGIYFSSGRQESVPKIHCLEKLEGFSPPDVRPGRVNRGLFLHDLFARIIPEGRGLYEPIREYVQWSRLTRSMGFIAWGCILLCIGGLLTFSFMKNSAALGEAAKALSKPIRVSPNLAEDIKAFDHYRRAIVRLQDQNARWMIAPSMELTQSRAVEKGLISHYCDLFGEDFLPLLDERTEKAVSSFPSATPDTVVWDAIREIITRLRLIEARLKGAGARELAKMSPMTDSTLKLGGGTVVDSDTAEMFNNVYLARLGWETRRELLQKEMTRLRRSLDHLTAWKEGNFQWLVHLANTDKDLQPVTLDRFWGGQYMTLFDKPFVPPAFTPQGREYIDNIRAQIEHALGDPHRFEKRRAAFEQWYATEYLQAWERFCERFDEGKEHLARFEDWHDYAEEMTTPTNPYFMLLDAMAENLKPLVHGKDTPPLVAQMQQLQKARKEVNEKLIQKATSFVAKAETKTESILENIIGRKDEDSQGMEQSGVKSHSAEMQQILNAARALEAYDGTVSRILPVTTSSSMAYKIASELFPGNGGAAGADALFNNAYADLMRVRDLVCGSQKGDDLFWKIFSGPVSFLYDYSLYESACYLQDQWNSQVVAAIEDIPDEKLRAALFDESNGSVWQFVKGPAAPFLSRSRMGYAPKEAWGKRIPFRPELCSFLNTGSLQTKRILPEYYVNVEALPTDTNEGVRSEPYCTTLELTCSDGVQRLENYNYPAQQLFKWKPDQCRDVSLQINFINLSLVKKYAGPGAFAVFLTDFAGGTKKLTPDDFPEQREDLQNYGIEEIIVQYQFEGSDAATKVLMREDFSLPGTIAECWGGRRQGGLLASEAGSLLPKLEKGLPRFPSQPPPVEPEVKKKVKEVKEVREVKKDTEVAEVTETGRDEGKEFFVLNVRSIPDRQSAARMLTAFLNMGYDPQMKETISPSGKKTYRVEVGSFETKQIAEETASQLKSEAILAGRSLKVERRTSRADADRH
jgi:type VI secretion system protein ImpL